MRGDDRFDRDEAICIAHALGRPKREIAKAYRLSVRQIQNIVAQRTAADRNTADWRERFQSKGKVFIRDIIAQTSIVFGVTVAELRGERRRRHIAKARCAVCFLAREMAGQSYPAIGHALGGRDHSTTIHASRKCVDYMAESDIYRSKVERVRDLVLGVAPPLPVDDPELEPEPRVEPHRLALTDVEQIDWWDLSDDELISRRITEYREHGGSFVEVRA